MANYMYLTHTHTQQQQEQQQQQQCLLFALHCVVGAFAVVVGVGNATQNNDKYNNYGQKRQQRCH